MTDQADEMTTPFVERLRDDLLYNLPRHRQRRRRRRQLGAAVAAVATVLTVVAVAALASGPGAPGGDEHDDRGADVATESTVPGTTETTDPPGMSPPADPSLAVVGDFLDDLGRGDHAAAAGRWTGYPNAIGADADAAAARVAGIEQMVAELPWLADPAYIDGTLEALIWQGGHQVVTMTASTGADQPMEAAAFVVDRGSGRGDAVIERLPSPNPTSTPASGTAVTPGQEVVVPVTLVEAVDVVAWFGGVEVPVTITNEVDEQTVTVHVPDTALGQTSLTILTTTPELPVAYAFWFPVELGG